MALTRYPGVVGTPDRDTEKVRITCLIVPCTVALLSGIVEGDSVSVHPAPFHDLGIPYERMDKVALHPTIVKAPLIKPSTLSRVSDDSLTSRVRHGRCRNLVQDGVHVSPDFFPGLRRGLDKSGALVLVAQRHGVGHVGINKNIGPSWHL